VIYRIEKAKAQRRSAKIIIGRVYIKIRLRPRRSMRMKATRVKVKFVTAMERDVNVGEEKLRRENMVAEKYMREFYRLSVTYYVGGAIVKTYKTAKLLEALKHACYRESTTVSSNTEEISERCG
jgi:hypothetical protein